MDFDRTDPDTGEKVAMLYPSYKQNVELKKVAIEAGDRDMVKFSRDPENPGFMLYENRLGGRNADELFGRFATPEAKDAFMAEKTEFEARRANGERVTQSEISEDRKYYPAIGNGDREALKELRKQREAEGNPIKISYNPRAKAFVHYDGPTEGLERFQTPEAKAAWVSEENGVARDERAARTRRERTAEAALDVAAERAAGNHFVADNAMGFRLPSKDKFPDEHAKQVNALSNASEAELSRVWARTRAEESKLSHHIYGVQIKAAKEKDPYFDKGAWDKKSIADRGKVVGRIIPESDYIRVLQLKNGLLAINREAKNRGLVLSVEQAREKSSPERAPAAEQREQAPQQSAPKAETAAQQPREQPAVEAKATGKGKGKGRAEGRDLGGALAAAMASQGMER